MTDASNGEFPALPPESRRGDAHNGEVRLRWRAYGEGPAVLLVMGFMATGDAFHRLIPHIVEAGYEALTFDNRGTGESDRVAGIWSMTDLVGDTLAVMDAAGLARAHIVGASMGGMVVQHLAIEHPKRVRSLVLACTEPTNRLLLPPPWRMLAAVLSRPVLGSAFAEWLAAPVLYSDTVREEGSERLTEDARLRDKEATPIVTAASQAAAILRHNTTERLADIRAPVLVLHGEQDKLIEPREARTLARCIPNAELVMIDDSGHYLTTDSERESAEALVKFIEACERRHPHSLSTRPRGGRARAAQGQ